MENKKPLSPHIQIYSWNISSLISISHRITGVINILALTLICLWIALLLLGESNYEYIKFFLQSFFGKFLIICLTWSFIFQILSEIRHLFWDFGYGFEIITSKISGLFVIFGSFILTVLIYLIGKQII
jgi:succinate dehydrogenase / fumarate reductase cytochrome b subunit